MPEVAAFRHGYAYVHERPDRPLRPGEVRLAVQYISASPGTDSHEFQGDNPTGAAGTRVGRVIEVAEGADEKIRLGDLLYADGQYEEHIIFDSTNPKIYWGKLNPRVSPMSHTFIKLSAIALNGILDAPPNIERADVNMIPNPGNTVVVLGLGVIGQLITQLAVAHGAKNVVLLDGMRDRVDLALAVNHGKGAKLWPARSLDGLRPVVEWINHREQRRGALADACFEVTGSPAVLNAAIGVTGRDRRTVVTAWHHGSNGQTPVNLEGQFHTGRGTLVSSQISGVRPELQQHWDRQRLCDVGLGLMAEGKIDPSPFISEVHPFGEGPIEMYFDKLARREAGVMGAVFGFEDNGAVLELPRGLGDSTLRAATLA